MNLDRRAAWLAIAYLLAFVAGVAIIVNLLTQIPDMAGVTGSDAYAHANIGLVVLVALVFATLSVVFLYLGEVARHKREPPSALYLPIMIESLTLFVIFGLAALSGLAREHDGLRTPLGAAWIRTPAVQLLQVLLIYSGLLTACGWFLAIILRTQGLRTRGVVLLFVELVTLGAALVCAAAWL